MALLTFSGAAPRPKAVRSGSAGVRDSKPAASDWSATAAASSCLWNASAGFSRDSRDHYTAHDQPKQLYMCELRPQARKIIHRPRLPASLREPEADTGGPCPFRAAELGSLYERLRQYLLCITLCIVLYFDFSDGVNTVRPMRSFRWGLSKLHKYPIRMQLKIAIGT